MFAHILGNAGNAWAQNVPAADNNDQRKKKSIITGSISPDNMEDKALNAAVAFKGRLLGDEQTARLIIELDGNANIEPFYMNNPPRLVLDLSNTVFRFENPEFAQPPRARG